MRSNLFQRTTVITTIVGMSVGAFAQTPLTVPSDQALGKQAGAAVKAAEDEGNPAAAVRAARRWLEVYPNEPVLQAAIYQTMSVNSEKAGDAKAAADFAATAKALDPTLDGRLQAAQTTTTTRGDKGDKILAAMQVAMATMAAISAAREAAKEAREAKAAQRAAAAAAAPVAPPPPAAPVPPPAPVGAPGAPPAGGGQPMPGYDPAAGGGSPAVDPNAAPANYAPAAAVVRGDAFKPIRVVHDHSLANDTAYFAKACGALLNVDGTTLTFTSGGGERPRVIQAADIREIRMNTTIGTAVGAFHITTKQGLYLHLAPASGKAEDARSIIAALTKALGL